MRHHSLLTGENYDELALEKNINLIIESEDGENFVFSNVWVKSDSYSTGKMYDIKFQDFEETDEKYGYDVISFLWKLSNSYDDETGTCKVEITTHYTENLMHFECRIDNITKVSSILIKAYHEH